MSTLPTGLVERPGRGEGAVVGAAQPGVFLEQAVVLSTSVAAPADDLEQRVDEIRAVKQLVVEVRSGEGRRGRASRCSNWRRDSGSLRFSATNLSKERPLFEIVGRDMLVL
jgi:hypothetical protein